MNSELITHRDPKSPISEVFKTLRTNLQFMKHKDESISLLVTSTMPGEGKTWVTSNLGIAFAQSDKKVVIIDSDMRKGRLHNVFDTKIFPGLSNYLAEDKKSIKDYLIKTEMENLWIIPAGNVPPNPSELLSTERMLQGLEELKRSFDVILFDSTPCMLVTDAVIISRIVDATMIVSSHKLTKMENLKTVQKNIENVGGKIAGVIINRIPVSLKKYKSKYYYYGERSKTEDVSQENNSSRIHQEEVTYVEENDYEQIAEGEQEDSNQNRQQKSKKKQEQDEIMEQIDQYLDDNK
ncbi:MAG: CpsD/CapB family tyrosine-protein kinase [Clostridia bacterium]|nr:CpsD/CapB family tyrosine-protein kinase [Clostridia bacterium]